MNQSSKILSALFLTAIYCFGIYASTIAIEPPTLQGNASTELGKYFTPAAELSLNYSSSLNTASNPNTAASYFQSLLDTLWGTAHKPDSLFEAAFTRYVNLSGNFLIRCRKTDVIFPFHYFW